MELAILTPETAPTDSRPVLDGIASDLGFVPNLAGTIAASPTLLSAFDGMRRAVSAQAFNPVHREIAGLAVGVAVDNAYGVAFHSTVLSRLGVADAEIDVMRAGNEPTDPTRAAVYAFARAVAVDRGAVAARCRVCVRRTRRNRGQPRRSCRARRVPSPLGLASVTDLGGIARIVPCV